VQTEIEKLEHRLYGNGQPGDIQRIDSRVDSNTTAIRELQEFKWKAMGIGAAICFFSGGGTFSLEHLLKALGGQ